MKNIDIKSLIIGALLTSTVLLGVAATGKTDKWDDMQEWAVGRVGFGAVPGPEGNKWVLITKGRDVNGKEQKQVLIFSAEWPEGWEPVERGPRGIYWHVRKRIK